MTSFAFTNSQLGSTIRTSGDILYTDISGVVFTDNSQLYSAANLLYSGSNISLLVNNSGYISEISQDVSPQLGANLDINNYSITGLGSISTNTGIFSVISITSGSTPQITTNNIYNLSGNLYYQNNPVAVLPTGGSANQILQKISDSSYDLQWIDNYSTESRVYVKNSTESSLSKGQAVYISSAQGDHPLISLSIASGENTSSKTLGLLRQNLLSNEFGYVVSEGILSGIDTSAANSAGDTVWLSPTTPGGLVYGSANKPYAPNHMVFIGYVLRKNQNEGIIYVKIQNGYELEELHNVAISGVSNNQFLKYESSSDLWKNYSLISSYITDFNTSVSGLVSGIYAPLTGATFTGPVTSTSGNFTNSLQLNGTGVSINGHTHTSSNITDFNSSVSGLLPVKNITAGSYIQVSSTTGNYTIAATGLQPSGNYADASHTHTSSDITNFNTSVSGLLPTISNSGDNRVLTSTGSTVGINAESNLTFDGTNLSAPYLLATYSSGDEGGEIQLAKPPNGTLSGGITIDAYQNKLRFFEQGGNARGFYLDLSSAGAGVSTNLAAGGGSGSATSVSNYADNRIITSDGTSTGLNAESNLTFNGTLLTVSGLVTANSGNFTSNLQFNGTGVSISGHTHSSSDITNFNSAVSGLISGIYAPLTGTLNQFANTTSSQLSSVISDETGSGLLVFNNSPTFTGTPLVPTAASGTNTNQIASTSFVRTEISNLVSSAPSTLDTLNELAIALGNDANFSTTITNNLAGKANLSGASFTGSISAPSGSFTQSLQVNGTGVSLSGHTHTASQITDFNSSVSGLLPVKNIIAGTGISVSSSDGSFTINLSSSSVTGYEILTSDKSLFSVSGGYQLDNLQVFYNGLKLINGTDYTATNGSTFSLSQSGVAGDVVEWIGISSIPVSSSGHNHTVSQITNFNSGVSGLISGIYSPINTPTFSGLATFSSGLTSTTGNFTTSINISNNTINSETALNIINSSNLYLWSNFR